MKTYKLFYSAGGILAGLAVMAGAFGAHMLDGVLSPDALETYSTGVQYQMYHALGLLGVAWGLSRWKSRYARISGWLFLAGILLFSGSLYLLAFTGTGWFGAITPFGGVVSVTLRGEEILTKNRLPQRHRGHREKHKNSYTDYRYGFHRSTRVKIKIEFSQSVSV